jgi:8-oxo-dGTP diphosphatase
LPVEPVEVAAALIWRGEKLLICQRPAHKARGLLWEFPGGKREAGETLEDCLIRECEEELGVRLAVRGQYAEVTHEYPDITVHVRFLDAEIRSGTPERREHNALRWVNTEELSNYDFCPADYEVLGMLKQRKQK